MTVQPRGRRPGERGSLPLALLAAIIVGGIVVVLVARIVVTQSQVRFDQAYHGALPTADAGVNWGKHLLNSETSLEVADEACVPEDEVQGDGLYKPSEFPVGCSTAPETQDVNGKEYTFTLERVSIRDWDVASIGVHDEAVGSEVSRRAIGTITERPLIDVALFADSLINFAGSNAADSYSSSSGNWCSGYGFIATNGDIVTSGTSGGACHTLNRTVDRVQLHNVSGYPVENATDEYPGGDRCEHAGGGEGANCREVSPESPEYLAPDLFDEPLQLSLPDNVAFIQHAIDACIAGGELYEDPVGPQRQVLRTSDDPYDGILTRGTFDATQQDSQDFTFPGRLGGVDDLKYHCADDVIFDVDTEINASTGDPVVIVARDSVTIQSGGEGKAPHVGCTEGAEGSRCVAGVPGGPDVNSDASSPESGRLWIFTDGEINLGNHSAFAGILWGPKAKCSAGAQGEIFGSLICGLLPENLGGWKFHYDDALLEVSSGEYYTSAWREEFLD